MVAADQRQLQDQMDRLSGELATFTQQLGETNACLARTETLVGAYSEHATREFNHTRENIGLLFDERSKHADRLTRLESTRVSAQDCAEDRGEVTRQIQTIEGKVGKVSGRVAVAIGVATVVATMFATILQSVLSAFFREWFRGAMS
ncbi:MAG TPA: hypothetical protein VMY42_26385 [Thermoguttaceae bacterium]|nr:hypothetical protein [Thermoguttaceae bacterium]